MDASKPDDLDNLNLEAQGLGRRIGLLLASARLPDEQKRAWLELIPSMDPGQLSAFASALEGLMPDVGERAFLDLAHRLETPTN